MKKYIFILAIGLGIFFLPHLSLADALTPGVQTQTGTVTEWTVDYGDFRGYGTCAGITINGSTVSSDAPLPTISSFSSSPSSISYGALSTLSWDVTGASSVAITGDNLSLSTSTALGTVSVTPDTTGSLIYTLTATSPNGTSTATTTITVAPVCSTLGGAGTASGTAPARIDLSWTSTAPSVTGYSVLISNSNGGPYTQVGTTTNNSYEDNSGLSNGSTYYFVLQPFDDLGQTVCQSNQAAITIPHSRGH